MCFVGDNIRFLKYFSGYNRRRGIKTQKEQHRAENMDPQASWRLLLMADYSESAYKFWPLDVTLLHREKVPNFELRASRNLVRSTYTCVYTKDSV
jgi:hypothetical protein